jgi:glycosyltransferase involved in cell wall biosynthesis
MPAVTIGLPVFNGGDHLDETLGSLSRQTFGDYEIIVSDNASTDITQEIVEKWARTNSRVRYFRQDKNIGPIENLRWIVKEAQSPWFMAASHDDRWSIDFVKLLYEAATASPGIVSAAPKVITSMLTDHRSVSQRDYLSPKEGLTPVTRTKFTLRTAHVGFFYGLHKTPIFSEALDSVKRFNHTWGYDYLAICHIALNGQITGNNNAIYYQRIKPLNSAFRRPETTQERYVHYRDFLAAALRALKDAPLTSVEKLALVPSVLTFSRHGEKPTRVLKSAVRAAIKSIAPRKRHIAPTHMRGWTITKKE